MHIHPSFWETRSKIHTHIFRDTSQCMGSFSVHGYCLFWPANCPEQHDTPPPQNTSHIAYREFSWHAHSKYYNLLYCQPFWLCQIELGLAVSKEEAAFTHHNQVFFPLLVSFPPPTPRLGPASGLRFLYYYLFSYCVCCYYYFPQESHSLSHFQLPFLIDISKSIGLSLKSELDYKFSLTAILIYHELEQMTYYCIWGWLVLIGIKAFPNAPVMKTV